MISQSLLLLIEQDVVYIRIILMLYSVSFASQFLFFLCPKATLI